MAKNGLDVGNTTSIKQIVNNAGQWIGDPTGVIQDGYDKANLAFSTAQSSFDSGNTTLTFAQAAFDKANTGVTTSTDQFARDTANAAYDEANTAYVIGQAAYDYANTINFSSFTKIDLGLVTDSITLFDTVDMGTL